MRILNGIATLLLLLAPLAHSQSSPAAWTAADLNYDRENTDLKLVEDDDAAAGKALELRVRGRKLKAGPVPVAHTPATDQLPAGRYRATVRLRMQGMPHSLGTGILLAACGAPQKGGGLPRPFAKRIIFPNEFRAPDGYQRFSFDIDIHESSLEREAFTPERLDRFLGRWQRDLERLSDESRDRLRQAILESPGQPLSAAALGLKQQGRLIDAINTAGRTPTAITIAVSLPQNKPGISGSRGNSSPFPSLRRLYVDTVQLEPVAEPGLVLRDFQAQYAWRRPGTPQRFHASLHNRSGAAQTGSLRIALRHGLDGRIELPPQEITLADGKYTRTMLQWDIPADAARWGYTAEAVVEVAGQETSRRVTWFTVHPRNNAVFIPYDDGARSKEAYRWHDPTAPKPNVSNHKEFWAPTPYDSAGLVPEDPSKPFLRGNSGGLESLPEQAARAKRLAEKGVASYFYLEQHGTGLRAWELYFDNPDQVSQGMYAAPSDLFLLKRMEAKEAIDAWLKAGGKDKPPAYPHVGFIMFNGLFKEVVDRVIQGHIELMKHVPYNGCRWDSQRPLLAFGRDILGHDLGTSQAELDQASLANLERYHREVRAVHPHFEYGINCNHGDLMGKVPDPFDFDTARKVLDRDPVVKAILADEGFILEEAWGHSFEVWNDYKIVCRNYLRANRYEDAAYKAAGGYHGHMFRDNGVEYTPDDIYQQTFSLLGGAHLCYVNYGPLPESVYDLGCYAARFGEFFWDPALRPLEDIADKVEVDAETDLWIAEAGYVKDTPEGTRLYILPVINPPVTEKWLQNRYGLLPEPIRDPIPVLVQAPEGYPTIKAVYHLENSPHPHVRALEFEADGGEVTFELPELVTFEVVVVEFGR